MYGIAFVQTLIFSNLSFMATREFLSSIDRSFRFINQSSIVSTSPVPISTTSISLLLASSSSLSSSLSEAALFRSLHCYLRHSVIKPLTELTFQSAMSELIAGKELHVWTWVSTCFSVVMSHSESVSLLKSGLNSSSIMSSSS